jgi:hypothetical protein
MVPTIALIQWGCHFIVFFTIIDTTWSALGEVAELEIPLIAIRSDLPFSMHQQFIINNEGTQQMTLSTLQKCYIPFFSNNNFSPSLILPLLVAAFLT